MPSAPWARSTGILAGKNHWLLIATVVGIDVVGQCLVEEHLFGQWREPALDIAGSGGFVAGVDVAEVALFFDEEVLVGEDD